MARSRPDFEAAWKRLFDPKTIIPFLIGSVTLGVLSNGVYEIVTSWFGHTPARVGMVVLGALLIFAVSVLAFAWRVMTPDTTHGSFETGKPKPHRGLILLVGKAAPCRKAVEYHRGVLERCWLICSTQTLELANDLRREFQGKSLQVSEPIVINNVNDPKQYCDQILDLYRCLPEGWEVSDVIADYLGMTSNASVGVVLAWLSVRFPLQYTLPVFNERGEPVGVKDPIEIVLIRDGEPRGGFVTEAVTHPAPAARPAVRPEDGVGREPGSSPAPSETVLTPPERA